MPSARSAKFQTSLWIGDRQVSKAALNMMMLCYHKTLAEKAVLVHGVCPGFLTTDFAGPGDVMRGMGTVKPEVAVKVVAGVVLGERDGDVGNIVVEEGIREW